MLLIADSSELFSRGTDDVAQQVDEIVGSVYRLEKVDGRLGPQPPRDAMASANSLQPPGHGLRRVDQQDALSTVLQTYARQDQRQLRAAQDDPLGTTVHQSSSRFMSELPGDAGGHPRFDAVRAVDRLHD